MRESSELRRQRILAAVESRGSVRVSDLAAELEVSVVTVRRDVEELAKAGRVRRGHGVARSLSSQPEPARTAAPRLSSGSVSLVVPERHTYLYEVLNGARAVLEEAGLRTTLHIAPQAPGAERPVVERALADGARGLLIAPRWRTAVEEDADHTWMTRPGVPVVVMERRPRHASALYAVDWVCSDHGYGMRLAVDHMVSLGHRRIVLAARDDSPTARALRTAFSDACGSRSEIEDWTVLLSAVDAGPRPADLTPGASMAAPVEGHDGLAAVIRERRATAVVLHSDIDALMLVQQLGSDGIRVPQDCSVVAYDDVVAALGSPPLTAVAPPKTEVGRTAAELLMRRLGGELGAARHVELVPALKVRGSSSPLAPPGG